MSKVVVSIGDKEYLTPEETLAYLSISKGTLEKWKRMGLRFKKIERKVYYSKTQIADFLSRFDQ